MEEYVLEYRYFLTEPETVPYAIGEYKFKASGDVNACREANVFLKADRPEENQPREFVRLIKIIPMSYR